MNWSMIFPKATMVIHLWLAQMIPLRSYTHEYLLRGDAKIVSKIIKGGKKERSTINWIL